jgi:hypothetical protein
MGGKWARWLAGTLIALLTALTLGVLSVPTASAAGTGSVYVVHAIAGTTAQISLDGEVLQASAAPKSVIGPLQLSEGQHVLEFKTGSTVLVSARFTVTAGDQLDVVGHRAADRAMTPLITVFRNDLSPVAPGKTRLVVSHVAVAEPADIRLDGKPYFRNVANAESLSVVVPAGSYSLDIVPTATASKSILEPVRINLEAGTLTRVFAFGNPDENTSDAIVQVLKVPVVGANAPTFVHTGDGGQAAQEYVTSPVRLWSMAGAAIAGLALAGAVGAALGSARSARLTGSRRSQP